MPLGECSEPCLIFQTSLGKLFERIDVGQRLLSSSGAEPCARVAAHVAGAVRQMLPSTTGIRQPNLGHIVPACQTVTALPMHIRPGDSAHQFGGGLVTVEVSGTGMLAAGDDQGSLTDTPTVSKSSGTRGFITDHPGHLL